jgi:tetratricopeptide (TPR) repeat protein
MRWSFPWKPKSEDERIHDLYWKGRAVLQKGNAKKAHRIADELARLRNSGAYEIQAGAQWLEGDRNGAIQTLDRGIISYPQVALLWSYLGEFLSSEKRYDEAIRAFERTREGLAGSNGFANMNIAIVHYRAGDYKRALDFLDTVDEDPPRYRVLDVRACILVDSGRFEEANEVLEELESLQAVRVSFEDRARWISLRAQVELAQSNNSRARELARQCLRLDRTCFRAHEVLNRLNSES